MTGKRVKRSSESVARSNRGLPAGVDARVGGRQGGSGPGNRGGGYLNTCNASELREPLARDRDTRLDELREMGLAAVWMRVAEEIGVDAFLATWRILDSEPSLRTGDVDMIELRMRPFRSYLRYQRNRYIESLSGTGMSLREIQEHVRRQLCERISIRHISRIASGT